MKSYEVVIGFNWSEKTYYESGVKAENGKNLEEVCQEKYGSESYVISCLEIPKTPAA